MDAEQFYAASLEAQRAHLAATERVHRALETVGRQLAEAFERLGATIAEARLPVRAHEAEQLELAVHANGHAPAAAPAEPFVFRTRCDGFDQEMPRGISWDGRGQVWQVDATPTGKARRRVRVPAARFEGDGKRGLAEACHVRSVLLGIDTRQHLAALHPDTARDVAEAMAR